MRNSGFILLILCLAGLAAGVAHAQVIQPQSILIRDVKLIAGDDIADTVSVNIMVEEGTLTIITQDRIPRSQAELVIDGEGGFVLGSLDIGDPASFAILDQDPREDVEVLLDTAAHATFTIHDGRVRLNTLSESDEAEEEEAEASGWLAYTPHPMVLPTTYKDEDKWNRWDTRWITGIFTAALLLDRQTWPSWDWESELQVGDLTEFEGGNIRGFRVGAIGTINFERPWVYTIFGATNSFDKGYDSSNDDSLSFLDWRLDAALPWDLTISAGKQKEPISLERVMSLIFNPMQERTAAGDAMLPSRNVGLVISGTGIGRRATWGAGVFNDWFDAGQSFDESATQYVVRITSAIGMAHADSHLLHAGFGFRYSDAREGIRFVTEPEFDSAPLYHDTGSIDADKARTWAGELGWRVGPFWAVSELLWSDVDAPAAADPDFFGYHVMASWTLTGEMRPYNRRAGIMGRIPVAKSVYEGGKGAWELAVRWSELDLNDALIDGGHSRIASAGVNWWLTPFFQVNINYRHIQLDRFGTTGVSDGLNSRILLVLE